MMKWILLGAVFFVWFIAPWLFNLMIRHDRDTLSQGLHQTQVEATGYETRY